MPSDADIRAWAREQGMDVPTRGRLNPSFREAWEAANPEAAAAEVAEAERQAAEDPPQTDQPYADDDPGETGEVRPVVPRSARGGGLAGLVKGVKGTGAAPARTRKRVPLESIGSGAWVVLSNLARSFGYQPTATVLALQAPAAGLILEDALKGTVVDRLVQPIARLGDKGQDIMALLMLPTAVTVMTARPELAPAMLPMVRSGLRTYLVASAPKLAAREAKERKALEALGVEDLDVKVEEYMYAMFGIGGVGVPDDAGPASDAA